MWRWSPQQVKRAQAWGGFGWAVHIMVIRDGRLIEIQLRNPREQMEAEHRHETNKEIVLVGADSIETVMLTHGNYFDAESGTHPTASPYLAGV
jgi:hypothetical protein